MGLQLQNWDLRMIRVKEEVSLEHRENFVGVGGSVAPAVGVGCGGGPVLPWPAIASSVTWTSHFPTQPQSSSL